MGFSSGRALNQAVLPGQFGVEEKLDIHEEYVIVEVGLEIIHPLLVYVIHLQAKILLGTVVEPERLVLPARLVLMTLVSRGELIVLDPSIPYSGDFRHLPAISSA